MLFLKKIQAGKFPKFVSKEMEAMYIEELKSSVNQLMANLESMPVSKGGEFKLQKLKRGHNTSIIDMGQEDENQLSKSDVVLSFTLEVRTVLAFRQVSLAQGQGSHSMPSHRPREERVIFSCGPAQGFHAFDFLW